MSSPGRDQQTSISKPGLYIDPQLSRAGSSPSINVENVRSPMPSAHSDRQSGLEGTRPRGESSTSILAGRLRSASRRFEESSLPKGMWDATASIASSIPTLADVRRGSFGSEGWSAEGQIKDRERRGSLARRHSSQTGDEFLQRPSLGRPKSPRITRSSASVPQHGNLPEVIDDKNDQNILKMVPTPVDPAAKNTSPVDANTRETAPKFNATFRTTSFENGYHFPPKHTWAESTLILLTGFWNYATTPVGFLVVVYMLNIVAWGGMIFLLLCNAAPAMCYPDCNDINSPRRIWIEYDSQILTALFCVTGFGLIPWRFRDLYYLLKYRFRRDQLALRRLAGVHRDWFRLEGSQNLPVVLGPENIESRLGYFAENSVPYPLKAIPNAPLTGIRAPPTPIWKLDYVIWMFVWNTFLQAVLSGLMWGFNRYDRPPWSTGVFVALACIVAACGGIMIFQEGKKVKGVEGVPISQKDQETLRKDKEVGLVHFNNIKDKLPKEKKSKRKMGKSEVTNAVGDEGVSNKAPEINEVR